MSEKLVDISIDRTMLIQVGNFLVLMLALHYLLFKPVRRFLEERRAHIDGPKADAVRLDREAEAKLSDYEEAIAAARREVAEQANSLREQLARESRERVTRARERALDELQRVVRGIERDSEGIRTGLRDEATRLSRIIAEKVLGRPV